METEIHVVHKINELIRSHKLITKELKEVNDRLSKIESDIKYLEEMEYCRIDDGR